MKHSKDLSCIILAGGKSSRMGTEKGLLRMGNITCIEYIANLVRKYTHNIILIANNPEYSEIGLPVYGDLIKNKGPIGGIYTGLYYSKTELNLITACDMPFISKEIINSLLENIKDNQIVLFEKSGQAEPFPGIYRKNCMTLLTKIIEKNELSLQKLPSYFKTLFLDMPDEATVFNNPFFNMNTREDYEGIRYRGIKVKAPRLKIKG